MPIDLLRRPAAVFAALLVAALAAPVAAPVAAQDRARLEQMAPIERQDFGVPASPQLHAGAMHGPTPATIPGAQVVTTQGLVALLQGGQVPFVLVDVLGQLEALPGAVPAPWLAQPGRFDDAVQQQARQWLEQASRGRRDTALVFYCLSRECWLSYNAALRAVQAGFANVLWYRGGLEAWKAAGLPLQPLQSAAPTAAPGMPPTTAPPFAPGQPPAMASTFVPVTPLPPGAARANAAPSVTGAPPQEPLGIGRGRFFSFALPPNWRVGEEGQFAITLVAPDERALTLMIGNAGMLPNHPPAQYVRAALSAIRPQDLQIGPPRPARPAAGFSQAVVFEVAYRTARGNAVGLVKVSEAPAYDTKTMVMTAALSAAEQWPGYSTWLPMVAEQVSAHDGAAFGRRGVMQQNLQMSTEFGAAAARYREWSQQNWAGVVAQRNDSVDQRNRAFRENLGGVQTYASPFGATPPVELPTTSRYYWQDRQGRYVGTDDPGADPNVGSTGEWRRMERVRP